VGPLAAQVNFFRKSDVWKIGGCELDSIGKAGINLTAEQAGSDTLSNNYWSLLKRPT
jgi:hypothetical protein